MQIGIDSGTGEVYIPEPPPTPPAPEPPPLTEQAANYEPAPSANTEPPVSNNGYQPTETNSQTNSPVNNQTSENANNQQTNNYSQSTPENDKQSNDIQPLAISIKTGVDLAMNKVFFDHKLKTYSEMGASGLSQTDQQAVPSVHQMSTNKSFSLNDLVLQGLSESGKTITINREISTNPTNFAQHLSSFENNEKAAKLLYEKLQQPDIIKNKEYITTLFNKLGGEKTAELINLAPVPNTDYPAPSEKVAFEKLEKRNEVVQTLANTLDNIDYNKVSSNFIKDFTNKAAKYSAPEPNDRQSHTLLNQNDKSSLLASVIGKTRSEQSYTVRKEFVDALFNNNTNNTAVSNSYAARAAMEVFANDDKLSGEYLGTQQENGLEPPYAELGKLTATQRNNFLIQAVNIQRVDQYYKPANSLFFTGFERTLSNLPPEVLKNVLSDTTVRALTINHLADIAKVGTEARRNSPYMSIPGYSIPQEYADSARAALNQVLKADVAFNHSAVSSRAKTTLAFVAKSELEAAQANVDAAKKVAEPFEKRLATDLAQFGSALTDEQRKQYIQDFKSDNSQLNAYKNLEAANLKMLATVHNNTEILKIVAGTSEEQSVRDPLYNGIKTLTNSKYAEAGLIYVNGLLNDARTRELFAGKEAFDVDGKLKNESQFSKEILGTGIKNMGKEKLATYSNPVDAAQEFGKAIDRLNSINDITKGLLDAAQNRQDAVDKLKQIKSFEDFFVVLASGNSDPLASAADDWVKRGFIGNSLLGVCFAYNVVLSIDKHSDPNASILEKIKPQLDATKAGLDVSSGFIGTLTYNHGVISTGGKAANAGKLLARLAPFVGLGASTVSFLSHWNKLQDKFDVGLAVSLVGDAASVLGGALEFTPLAPVGKVIGGIGTAISALGDLWTGHNEEQNRQKAIEANNDRQAKALRNVLGNEANDELIKVLVNANPAVVSSLGELKFSHTYIRELTKTNPILLQEHSSNMITDIAKSFKLNEKQFSGLLNALGGNNKLSDFTGALLRHQISTEDRTPENWLILLASVNVNGESKDAVTKAKTYLEGLRS